MPFEKTDKSADRDQNYFYQDSSGRYKMKRELRTKGNKIILRSQLFSIKGSTLPLEKSITVSTVGYVSKNKDDIRVLPSRAQFDVWFEKKRFTSQFALYRKQRKLYISLRSPEKQWSGDKEFSLPRGKYFCFFSQLPECIEIQGLLFKARNKRVPIQVIWDSYPYHTEQYDGVDSEPIVSADLYLTDSDKNELKYALDIGNQIIFFHFNKKLKFERMFWVSQGISLQKVE